MNQKSFGYLLVGFLFLCSCTCPEKPQSVTPQTDSVSREKIDMFIADLIEEQTEPIPAAPASAQKNGTEKRVRNGLLFIERNGKTYNAQGF